MILEHTCFIKRIEEPFNAKHPILGKDLFLVDAFIPRQLYREQSYLVRSGSIRVHMELETFSY